MQHILVYADSLTWGIVPGTRQRLAFDARWPGVMEAGLNAAGRRVRVIEDCLNGRRTVWDDPFKPGRNGLQGLAQRIESHSPLSLVILSLGTNDFQSMHPHTVWHSAQGMATLVGAIRQAPIEPGMPVPPILILAPPPMGQPKGPIAPKFEGGQQRCERPGGGLSADCRRAGLPLLRRRQRHAGQRGRRHSPGCGPARAAGARDDRGGGGDWALSARPAPGTPTSQRLTSTMPSATSESATISCSETPSSSHSAPNSSANTGVRNTKTDRRLVG